MSDGSVQAWGSSQYGAFGNFQGGIATSPQGISPLPPAIHIVGALHHGLAIDREGRAFGWGLTDDGQLGQRPYASGSGVGAPVLVPGIDGALDLATGIWHTLFLRPDGGVSATGNATASGLPSASYAVQPLTGLSLAPNAWLLTDADGDGLPTWREYLAGLDPLNRDTNGNGLSDLVDVHRQGPSMSPDDDGDGLPNAIEIATGTDPFNADSDGDGVSDGGDHFPLDATRTQRPAADPNDTTPPVINLLLPASARPVGGGL
jgi:hypothetical protein